MPVSATFLIVFISAPRVACVKNLDASINLASKPSPLTVLDARAEYCVVNSVFSLLEVTLIPFECPAPI